MFDGITSNLPIVRRAFIALFLLATIFSLAWYKIVMQRRSLVVCYGTSYLSLVFSRYIHSPKGWSLHRENTSDFPGGIFHALESVAQLLYIVKNLSF